MRQSDTWAKAGAPLRPWLLMLWAVAWEQTPCGSLPDDDEAIAGKLDMPLKQFMAARGKLLRGWAAADDGRLYHGTLTERVLEMLEYRRREAARRAGNRGKPRDSDGSPAVVPRDTGGTPAEHAPDHPESPGTGTGTGTSLQDKPVGKARKRTTAPPAEIERPTEVPEPVWNDWHAVRKVKRAGPVTETAWEGLLREAARAGLSSADAVRACCEFGWQGFNAGWYAERIAKRGASVVPLRQQAIEEHNRKVGDDWLAEQERRDAAG